MMEDNYDHCNEKQIKENSNLISKLLVTAFENDIIEDEDLVKILYKLEILINHDSPTNSLKSQAIRSIGIQVL